MVLLRVSLIQPRRQITAGSGCGPNPNLSLRYLGSADEIIKLIAEASVFKPNLYFVISTVK